MSIAVPLVAIFIIFYKVFYTVINTNCLLQDWVSNQNTPQYNLLMDSLYLGSYVFLRDAFGEWWEGTILDVVVELDNYYYYLQTKEGKTVLLPVADISALIEKDHGEVIPFRKTIKLSAIANKS